MLLILTLLLRELCVCFALSLVFARSEFEEKFLQDGEDDTRLHNEPQEHKILSKGQGFGIGKQLKTFWSILKPWSREERRRGCYTQESPLIKGKVDFIHYISTLKRCPFCLALIKGI